jgi:hypothetical protein
VYDILEDFYPTDNTGYVVYKRLKLRYIPIVKLASAKLSVKDPFIAL